MRINVAIPEPHVDAPVLDAALEATTRLNETLLDKGEVPTFAEALDGARRGGIKWKPEPPGDEHFDHAATVMRRGWGDCDDLAPWHAASLRHSGEDPGAHAVVKRSGPKRWHAIVKRSDGSYEDPSREAGMGKKASTQGVHGAWLPLMPLGEAVIGGDVVGAYIVRPQMALRQVPGGPWQARADLPWYWREHLSDPQTPVQKAMTTLHMAPTASTALTGALDGAVDLGCASGMAHPEHLARLSAISDLAAGVDYDEVVGEYGEEHAEAALQSVVGFFGGLGKLVKSVTKPLSSIVKNPLIKTGLSFIPGGNMAATALDVANRVIPGGGGGARRAAPRPMTAPQPFFPSGGGRGAAPSGGGFNLSMRCVPFG